MVDNRFLKMLLFGELSKDKRDQGGPKKRSKYSLKISLKEFVIQPGRWETNAANRTSWRAAIRHGTSSYEVRRTQEAEQKR